MTLMDFHHADAHRVTDRIWIGGALGPDPDRAEVRLDELVGHGLAAILDCRDEADDSDFVVRRAPGVAYRRLGVLDDGRRPSDDWFERGTHFALDHLREGRPVLVHCAMGVNRGPSMGFAVMLRLGWGPVHALARIRERRPAAHAVYAPDALDWWFRRREASASERRGALAALNHWRIEHQMSDDHPLRQINLARTA